MLRVTDLNGLKKYDVNETAALILDDVNIESLTAEAKIGLVDVENWASVRILYELVSIRGGVVRAIVTNKAKEDYFGLR